MGFRKWSNDHPKSVMLITSLSLLILVATLVATYLPGIQAEYEYKGRQRARLAEYEYKERQRVLLNEFAKNKNDTKSARGKLIFERIPLKVKDLSGKIRPLEKKGRTVKCGDSLDVMWFPEQVLFMKEKGLFEQVLVAPEPRFSDLEWDGQNVWVSIPKEGIWIMDTSGKIVAKVSSESGLPPGEKGLLLNTIETGGMFAVGSFGPFGRGWCAVVEFRNGEASVNVFHEAKRVRQETDDEEEIKRDPFVAFRPYWIREYVAFTDPYDANTIFLGPRWARALFTAGPQKLFIRRCAKKYSNHPLIYPLEVDLDTLSVRIASKKTTYLGKDDPHLEYNGKLYVPGRIWYCIDPNTGRRERLVTEGQLPNPYRSLRGYWVSAHYGLVGWRRNRELWQIRVTDKEYEILKKPPSTRKRVYHTFSFEDENGPIIDWRRLKKTRIRVYRGKKWIASYDGRSRYCVPGTYKATMWGRNFPIREFEPVVVTDDSPKELVFKIKPDEKILYCGQVVDAITGKPMKGAFVMIGFTSNLAWITPDEWEELHNMPTNPSLKDEALWPVKNTSVFKLKGIVRTDSNGRFEMRLRRLAIIHEFVAFEENYLSTALSKSKLPPAKNGRVQMPPMLLFPAARIRIELYSEQHPLGYLTRVYYGFNSEGCDNPDWASMFFRMHSFWTRRGMIPTSYLEMNQTEIFHVPTGVSFRLKFRIPYTDRWCIPIVPQVINLKQGEMLDLGRCVVEPAMRIFLKVVDSVGNPIPHFRIESAYRHSEPYRTNEGGRTPIYVEPNSQAKLFVYLDEMSPDGLETVTFRIGGKEDEGKEFILQVSDDTVRHLSK